MQVQCSACSARYTIADEKIPIHGARIRCRKCQAVFSIERTGVGPPTPSALPLIPPTPQEAGPPPAAVPGPPAPSFGASPPGLESQFEHFAQTATPSAAPPPAPSFEVPPPALASPAPASQFEQFAQPAPPASGNPDVGSTQIERFATAFASVPETGAAPVTAPAPPPAPVFQAPAAPPQPAPPVAAAPAPAASASPFSPSAGIPEGLPEAERLKHERARRLARVLASDIAIYNKEKRDRGIKDGNLVAVLGYEIKKSWEVYKERVTAELANSTPYFRDALNEMLSEGKKVF